MNTLPHFSALMASFRQCASLAGVDLGSEALLVDVLRAPHKPPSKVPTGKLAVYVFFHHGICLKVGKAGVKSHARYVGQHYSPGSSQSNLAKSLLGSKHASGLDGVRDEDIGAWMRQNLDRVNILLNSQVGVPVQNLLESFLQCALKPRFEGFQSQRSIDA